MSVHSIVSERGTSPNRIPNVVEFFDRTIVKPIRRWHKRNKALDELYRLDERMLADIGIARNEIRQVVDGMFARDAGAYAQPPPTTPKTHRSAD
jgi:uncharacterized protein YjiS (DUF1127 family)